MTQLQAGQVVIVDWRDALPKEPNKQRPAIVVEDSDLFDPAYPNVLLVPLADDPRLAIPDLALTILPTTENGCPKPCYALAHHVTATSKHRVSATSSNITQAQLTQIRKLIANAIGLG
jgi:mRNA-degrading endonuclease toxin of MazEF toxin-antitoxin module